jgi:hypothetical protein
VAFDLDQPIPMPQSMARTSSHGLVPLGRNYFRDHYVTLAPGKTVTLAVNIYTKRYACTFKIRMAVVTSEGTFKLDIDQNGRPFSITAKAASAESAGRYRDTRPPTLTRAVASLRSTRPPTPGRDEEVSRTNQGW